MTSLPSLNLVRRISQNHESAAATGEELSDDFDSVDLSDIPEVDIQNLHMEPQSPTYVPPNKQATLTRKRTRRVKKEVMVQQSSLRVEESYEPAIKGRNLI